MLSYKKRLRAISLVYEINLLVLKFSTLTKRCFSEHSNTWYVSACLGILKVYKTRPGQGLPVTSENETENDKHWRALVYLESTNLERLELRLNFWLSPTLIMFNS